MSTDAKRTILVINPVAAPEAGQGEETLSIAHVPIEAMKANMESVLGEITEVFASVKEYIGDCKLEHLDVSLGIAVDGSVGILGSGVGAEAKGSVTLRIKLP